MLLAIDIGNTNTVFAVYRGSELIDSWRLETSSKRSRDEYAAFLKQLFDLVGLKWANISDVIVSSVVPEANFHIGHFCKKYLGKEPICVNHEMVNIKIDLDRPEEVGADRLVNAVAVVTHYQTPAIVVDFGTATTFDVIDDVGRYAGGVITPGVKLSVEALHRAAAKLPSVGIAKPSRAIGKNTVTAIQAGIYWGYMGLVEGLIEKIGKELPRAPFVIATGGLAGLFVKDTKSIHQVDEHLTLKGLLKIYQNYKGI